jgi:hypothetical protein
MESIGRVTANQEKQDEQEFTFMDGAAAAKQEEYVTLPENATSNSDATIIEGSRHRKNDVVESDGVHMHQDNQATPESTHPVHAKQEATQSVNQSNDDNISSESDLIHLSKHQSFKMTYPVGCSVLYDIRHISSNAKGLVAKQGIVKGISMDVVTRKLVFEVKNTYTSVVDIALEEELAFGFQCTVYIKNDHNVEVEGEVVFATKVQQQTENQGSRRLVYTTMFFHGDTVKFLEVDEEKVRFRSVATAKQSQDVGNTIAAEEKSAKGMSIQKGTHKRKVSNTTNNNDKKRLAIQSNWIIISKLRGKPSESSLREYLSQFGRIETILYSQSGVGRFLYCSNDVCLFLFISDDILFSLLFVHSTCRV